MSTFFLMFLVNVAWASHGQGLVDKASSGVSVQESHKSSVVNSKDDYYKENGYQEKQIYRPYNPNDQSPNLNILGYFLWPNYKHQEYFVPYRYQDPYNQYHSRPSYPKTPQPDQPYQPHKPIYPKQPYQPYQPHKPINPKQPFQPYQPHKPIYPKQPYQPYRPHKPIYPKQPFQPYEPHKPIYPKQPYQPYQPHKPIYPKQPSRSEEHYGYGVEKYYKLDTCEYRFILDMVQCKEYETAYKGKSYGKSKDNNGAEHRGYHQGKKYGSQKDYKQGSGLDIPNPNYPNAGYVPHPDSGKGDSYDNWQDNSYDRKSHNYGWFDKSQSKKYGYVELDSSTTDKYYGYKYGKTYYKNPYTNGYDGMYQFTPMYPQYPPRMPFYAPGLDNKPFSRFYASFKAGHVFTQDNYQSRVYHRSGEYQDAYNDFHNFGLENIAKFEVGKKDKITTYATALVGQTPYFNYEVRLLPNHCTVDGYSGRHTCITFTGKTHPYEKVVRLFVYVSREESHQRYVNYETNTIYKQQH